MPDEFTDGTDPDATECLPDDEKKADPPEADDDSDAPTPGGLGQE